MEMEGQLELGLGFLITGDLLKLRSELTARQEGLWRLIYYR